MGTHDSILWFIRGFVWGLKPESVFGSGDAAKHQAEDRLIRPFVFSGYAVVNNLEGLETWRGG